MIDWSYATKIIVIGFSLVITLLSGLAGTMVLIRRAHDRGIKRIFKREVPVEEISGEELSSDEVAAIQGAVLEEYMEITKKNAPVPDAPKNGCSKEEKSSENFEQRDSEPEEDNKGNLEVR